MRYYVKLLMFFFNFFRTTVQFSENLIFWTVLCLQRNWIILNDFTTLLEDSLRIYNFDQITLSGVCWCIWCIWKWAESIYINATILTRCMIKYDHSKSCLEARVTDSVVFEQWSTRAKKTFFDFLGLTTLPITDNWQALSTCAWRWLVIRTLQAICPINCLNCDAYLNDYGNDYYWI